MPQFFIVKTGDAALAILFLTRGAAQRRANIRGEPDAVGRAVSAGTSILPNRRDEGQLSPERKAGTSSITFQLRVSARFINL